MKYGKILYNYGEAALHSSGYNIGDGVQTIALENIYSYMGVDDSEIAEIDICDLRNYDDEYLLLPMYSMALGIGFATMPLSPKIIPLFISTHIAKTELSDDEVDYLRSYAPIGCRDEFSLNTMRRYGVPAYLSGCITVTFPQRKATTTANKNKITTESHTEGKVFFVDTPESLKPFIPEDILSRAEFTTHIVPIEKRTMTREDGKNNYQISKRQLERYFTEATLVVSSKQHAIIPCMAAGIPVIAACENISLRFSWFDKFIKIYSESEFKDIDWNPKPIEYEQAKVKLLDFFANKISEAFDKYKVIYEISDFYENRAKSLYGSFYYDRLLKLRATVNKQAENHGIIEYIIWGCGLAGNTVYSIIQNQFPDMKLVAAIDNFVEGFWHDVEIIKPGALDTLYKKDIGQFRDKKIILATYSGREECYRKMEALKLKENVDFIYVGTQNG